MTAAEPYLDTAGEMHWFKRETPLPVLGPCPHSTCRHYGQTNIAWGPDYEHYTLNTCDVAAAEGGCGGMCRGWSAEFPHGDPRRDYDHGWMQIAALVHA